MILTDVGTLFETGQGRGDCDEQPREQWRELAQLGVHSFQAYLFSRPLAAPDVADWLNRLSQPGRPRVKAFGWSKLNHWPLIAQSMPGN